jgi:hypothetical protein
VPEHLQIRSYEDHFAAISGKPGTFGDKLRRTIERIALCASDEEVFRL